MARCYYSGRGVPKDDAMAFSLASSSAESGSAYGQYVLGAMHFNGDCGVAASDQRAAELWELAAKQGHVASADWLSVMCAASNMRILSLFLFVIAATGATKVGVFSRTFTRFDLFA